MKKVRIYVNKNVLKNWNIKYKDIIVNMCEKDEFDHKDMVNSKSFITVNQDTLDDMYCDLDEMSIRIYLLYKICKSKNITGKSILKLLGLNMDKYDDVLLSKKELLNKGFIKSKKFIDSYGRSYIKHYGIIKKITPFSFDFKAC